MEAKSESTTTYCLVVPAGGSGQRMLSDKKQSGGTSKQFLKIGERSVIEHTLEPFLRDQDCLRIVIAVPDQEISATKQIFKDPRVQIIRGGNTRMQSVLSGLNVLHGEFEKSTWVMVHDAVRPNLHSSDLQKLKQTVSVEAYGGILAVPSRDTLKQVESGCVLGTLDRESIWNALTPQMFRLGKLYNAINRAVVEGFELSDESSAMEYVGARVILVAGRADNIKITYPEDLPMLKALIKERKL